MKDHQKILVEIASRIGVLETSRRAAAVGIKERTFFNIYGGHHDASPKTAKRIEKLREGLNDVKE